MRLRNTGLVPESFILKNGPISSEGKVYTSFENGVNLEIENSRIIFSESIRPEEWDQALIPKLSCRFIEILEDLNFDLIEVRPTILYRFDSNIERKPTAQKFLSKRLKIPLIKDIEFPQCKLNFSYHLEECDFEQEIKDIVFNASQECSESSGILSSGSIIYEREKLLLKKKSLDLNYLAEEIAQHINLYRTIDNNMILGHE
jgi:hypothetical protein